MKKFTFLLSLLLAFVGVTASAQVAFEASEAPSNGEWASNTTWYRMSLHGKYLSAYDATINGDIKNQSAAQLSGAGAYWCVVGDATSGYKFYNRAAGPGRVLGIHKGLLSDGNSRAFFCASSTNGTSSDPVGTLFSISAVSGKPTEFNIKLNGGENYYWNDRDNYLSYWNTTQAIGNGGSKVQFYKVELTDVEADDNANADTYRTALQNRLTAAKTAIDDSKVGYFSNAAVNAAQAVLDGESSKAGDYYFAKLELQANSPKANVIYRIQSGNTSFGTTKAIYHDGVAVKWGNEDVTNSSQYWFFTPYGNGYKLQAADAKTYFASAATLSNNAGYVEVVWYAPHEANIRVECGKSLHAQGHNGGNGANGNVIAYDETGFGGETGPCAWNIVEATLGEVKQIQVNTEAAPEYYEDGLKVGSITNEMKEAFNQKMAASTSLEEALRHINEELPLGGIDVNKYYRLVCVSPKVDTNKNVDASGNPADPTYTTLTRGQNNVVTAPFSKGNVDQLWKFEKVEGGYYLKNMNGNGYLNNVEEGGDARAKLVENPSYKFEIMSGTVATQKGLHVVGKNHRACLFAENHPNEPAKGDPYAVCGWHDGNDYKDAAWAWYIVEADDVEVALHAVNGKSYATTYLPVGVSAVTDAKAYVAATPVNNETVMTETANFGAKNGVLLVSETGAEKAVLTIGNVASVESALSGTLLAKDITNSQINYLVFGKNKDNANEVGFFEPLASVTSIPANRAFFEGATGGAIALNFGGNVTAIDQVVNNANVNAPIFDLAGRRVVKAAKGGVYIQNGKKFIVK